MHFSLPLGVAAPFAKDSPLFELFKEELSKMRESGQIGQVNTKYSVQKEGVKCSDGKVCTYAKSKGLFFKHWFLWHLLNEKSPFISGLVVDMSKTKKINSKPPIISGLNVNLSKVKRN